MIRVQNDRNIQDLNLAETSMFDVSTLFHPSLGIKISNGEIDKISQYLNEEVNLIILEVFLICFNLKNIFRKVFWTNLLQMKKLLKQNQLKSYKVENYLNQFVFLVLLLNSLLLDRTLKRAVK